MGTFVASRFKTAREEAGLTQDVCARSLGLSPEFISMLEAGKRAPSLDTLTRIASLFRKDVSFFLGKGEPALAVLFRAPAADLGPKARLELERFRRYIDDYLRLEEATGRRLALAPLYSGRLSAERMAAEERRRIGLGDEPIRDIFALLERNGLRILRQPLPSDVGISGAFVYVEAKDAAFALINSAQTPCRQTFTAAHEYCHFLKDRLASPSIDGLEIFGNGPGSKAKPGGSPIDRRDRFAQEFAAHFLMPPAKVREVAEKEGSSAKLSYESVLLLKRYFGVSALAMVRTLAGLGLLTKARAADYARIDPAPREREVFGSTDEEYGPGSGLDRGGAIVSDRYRIMEKEVSKG